MESQTSNIFYHVNEINQQKIIVDANNIEGNIVFPKMEQRSVNVHDVRTLKETFHFEKDSIVFLKNETTLQSFKNKTCRNIYSQELVSLLKNTIQAQEAIVFDHTIREDNSSSRPPARHAHVDYSPKSAEEQIHRYVDESDQRKWLKGHYAVVNTWRPIHNKVLSAPLGFVLPESISDKDLIKIDLIYPERSGEVLGALYNRNHKWIYMNEMDTNEIVVFNMFDNKGRKPVIHSAFDLESTKSSIPRKSIESRILVRF